MMDEKQKNNEFSKVSGGTTESSVPEQPIRTDILAFASSRRDEFGALKCRACGASIPKEANLHKCEKDGIVYNTYKLNPDKTIWRKD
ncbi:MAG: hypothetical protein LBF33_01805 [Oscillospiraceae bacterium]|jgi:hypothetical protein|nr:hypothetical protein [Oscillospiraceae bacterium]